VTSAGFRFEHSNASAVDYNFSLRLRQDFVEFGFFQLVRGFHCLLARLQRYDSGSMRPV